MKHHEAKGIAQFVKDMLYIRTLTDGRNFSREEQCVERLYRDVCEPDSRPVTISTGELICLRNVANLVRFIMTNYGHTAIPANHTLWTNLQERLEELQRSERIS